MIDLEQLWRDVESRSPTERVKELPSLREFLLANETDHAKALSGRPFSGALDKNSAVALEASIVSRVREVRSFSKYAAAEWLRLLYEAERIYQEAGGDVQHFTRLAALVTPTSSPFSPAQRDKARPVTLWRDAMHQWFEAQGECEIPPEDWVAGMVLSAVLEGALLDLSKIKTFIATLNDPLPVARSQPYRAFHQKFAGLGDFHTQRWFLDPLSQLLYFRKPSDIAPCSEKQAKQYLVALLAKGAVPKELLPVSLCDLVERSAADWYGHAARVDVEIIRRGVTAHAFHDRTWTRLFGGSTANRKPSRADLPDHDSTVEAHWRDDVSLLFPWWGTMQVEIAHRSTSFRALVAQRRASSGAAAAEATYLGWMAYLLEGGSATRDALAESTICSTRRTPADGGL